MRSTGTHEPPSLVLLNRKAAFCVSSFTVSVHTVTSEPLWKLSKTNVPCGEETEELGWLVDHKLPGPLGAGGSVLLEGPHSPNIQDNRGRSGFHLVSVMDPC